MSITYPLSISVISAGKTADGQEGRRVGLLRIYYHLT